MKAIIFDFDGVLVESVTVKKEAFEELFASYDRKIRNQVREYVELNPGVTRFDKFRYIYENILQLPFDKGILDALSDRFSKLTIQRVIDAPAVKGAMDFLQQHTSAIHFFVVSATPQEDIRQIVDQRGMSQYFIDVYGAPEKKSALINRIMVANGYRKNDVIIVGDTIVDFEAARAMGIPFIARKRANYNRWDPVPSVFVEDLTQLLDAVESAFNQYKQDK